MAAASGREHVGAQQVRQLAPAVRLLARYCAIVLALPHFVEYFLSFLLLLLLFFFFFFLKKKTERKKFDLERGEGWGWLFYW